MSEKKKILIVEDNVAEAQAFKQMLDDGGLIPLLPAKAVRAWN